MSSSQASAGSSQAPNPTPATITKVKPPPWLTEYHRDADLGFPDFHPPRPGQEEDSMAQDYVKNGFISKSIVTTDNFTVHEMIHDTWEKGDQSVLRQLGDLMSDVAKRRERVAPKIGPYNAKLPDRRTLRDAQVQTWFKELADPDVPLSKINKIIPYAPKGVELLIKLESNHVPPPRAVWYVRMLVVADAQSIARSRSSFNPSQYCIEWAINMTTFIKNHLNEIVLPRPQTGPTTSIRSTFKGVLSDSESREKWLSKFSYALAMLREMFAESLVDRGTVLLWVAQQVGTSTIPQLGFVVKLAEEYLEGLLEHRGFLRPFITGITDKLLEIARIPQAERSVVAQLSLTLGSLLQQTFIAFPDAFIYPRLWREHTRRSLLYHFLVKGAHEIVQVSRENPRARAIYEELQVKYINTDKRNRALLFQTLPERNSIATRVAMADVQMLNSIGTHTDICAFNYFDASTSPVTPNGNPSSFESKLNILLAWSISPTQFGEHRPFAVACILRCWRDEAKLRAIRRRTVRPEAGLQEQIFHWLNTSDAASQTTSLDSIGLLFGELCRKGLFSYEWFIQRLVARGEAGLGSVDLAQPSHLTKILERMPLPSQTAVTQRAVALRGVDAREPLREIISPQLRRDIREFLPSIFGGSLEEPHSSKLEVVTRSTYFEIHTAIAHWLLPVINDQLSKHVSSNGVVLGAESYSRLTELLRLAHAYPAILEISLKVLGQSCSADEITQVLDTFLRFTDIWASMDALDTIGEMLYATHKRTASSFLDSRLIVVVLLRPEFLPRLSPESRRDIEGEVDRGRKVSTTKDVPPILQEILDLPLSEEPDAPIELARDLMRQYGDSAALGLVIWDNSQAGIRQLGSNAVVHLQLYIRFMEEYQRSISPETSLDIHVQQWFRYGNGREEFSEFGLETWEIITPFLVGMVLKGLLSTSTIMENVAYVAWKQSAMVDRPKEQIEIFLRAANSLARTLMLPDRITVDPITGEEWPLIQVQRLLTQRQLLLSSGSVKSLFKAIRNLISLEVNPSVLDGLRDESHDLRVAICSQPAFRTTAFRHLTELKDVFVRPLATAKDVRLADALRQIIHIDHVVGAGNDSGEAATSEWKATFNQLNALGFARASVELRLMLERMGSSLESNNLQAKASAEGDIHELMEGLFARDTDPEETELTADVLTGIGGSVAAQFLNHGAARLAYYLNTLTSEPLTLPSIATFLAATGDLLWLLAAVSLPRTTNDEWATEWSLPAFEESTIDALMRSLLDALKRVTDVFGFFDSPEFEPAPANVDILSSPRLTDLCTMLARIVHFALPFTCVWSTFVKGISDEFISALFAIIMAYGGGFVVNPIIFLLYYDTISYVIDEVPKDSKNANIDLVRPITTVAHGLPDQMPDDYRFALEGLLPYVAVNPYTANLVHLVSQGDNARSSSADADNDGAQVGPVVQPRPWEWVDHLEEPSDLSTSESEPMVKNDASLPLETFMAKTTLDHRTGEAPMLTGQRYVADHVHAESLYERDWRETRIGTAALEDPESSESEEDLPVIQMLGSRLEAIASVEDSRSFASLSGVSPALTRASSGSQRVSTAEHEIIDVDALPNSATKGRKRKAPASSSQWPAMETVAEGAVDDDIEILDAEPAASTSAKGKRGRGRAPSGGSRGRGKKK